MIQTTELPPVIAPRSVDGHRPRWSVMIPTYNCDERVLIALGSVLDQDQGPRRMQIAIVDDRSSDERWLRRARELGGDRLEFYRNEQNLGIGGNWNSCIRHSRGDWVHILHQDDQLLTGFYAALDRGIDKAPQIGSAIARHLYIDEEGMWTRLAPPLRNRSGLLDGPGVVDDWLTRICTRQWLQCPAVTVRREVYENFGGFREDLCYILDWEMWIRIAMHYRVWYDPTPLAAFREHGGNQSSRLASTGANLRDVYKGMRIMRGYLPPERRDELIRRQRAYWRVHAEELAAQAMVVRDRATAMVQLHTAMRHEPRLWFSRRAWALHYWALRLWVRDRITAQPSHVRKPNSPVVTKPTEPQ